ncbi:MAG: hypothetical protein ACYDDC_01995 [Thermoplasmataceae archaeon]
MSESSAYDSSGNNSIYSMGRNIRITNSTGTNQFNVNVSSPLSISYYFAGNMFIAMNDSSIFWMNLSGDKIVNGSYPKILGPANILIKGVYRLNFTVNNIYSYRSTLHIFNRTFKNVNSSSFLIDSYSINNGVYQYVLSIYSLNGNLENYSGLATVDNAIPEVNSSVKNQSMIYSGELIRISVNDEVGLKSLFYSFFSHYNTTSENFFQVTVPFNISENYVYLNYTVMDKLGETFNFSMKYRYINENSEGFSSSIFNGEYFRNGTVPLSFEKVSNVSYYVVEVTSGTILIFSEKTNNTSVVLRNIGNGHFTLNIYGHCITGNNITLENTNFTIITYSPGFIYTFTSDTFYSFSGNSKNNSLELTASSNISSRINVSLYSGSSHIIMTEIFQNSCKFYINSSTSLSLENGLYYIVVNFTSLSGTFRDLNLSFIVNNTIPLLNIGSVYYTNISSFNLSIPNYPEVLFNFSSHNISYFNGSIFMNSTGKYEGRIKVSGNSGNIAETNISVYYFVAKPQISLFPANSAIVLRDRPYTTINVSISDQVPMKDFYYIMNNQHFNISKGSLMIRPLKDGTFNFTVYAYDKCGNSNHSRTITITGEYYPQVFTSYITGIVVGKYPYLSAQMTGYALNQVNIKWYVNSKYVSSGDHLKTPLPGGYVSVEAVIFYGNHTIIDKYRTLSIPNTPVIMFSVGILAFFIFRVATIDRRKEQINEFLKKIDHISLKNLRKNCRKNRFSYRSVRRTISEKMRTGEITYGYDLDGKKYFLKK